MKVISVGVNGGFLGDRRRRQGDVFQIPDVPRRTPEAKEAALPACKEVMDKAGTVPEAFSSLWMRKAPKGAVERTSAAPPATAPVAADLRARIAPEPGSDALSIGGAQGPDAGSSDDGGPSVI